MTLSGSYQVRFRVWLGAAETAYADIETWYDGFEPTDPKHRSPADWAHDLLCEVVCPAYFAVDGNKNWQIIGTCKVIWHTAEDMENDSESLELLEFKTEVAPDDYFDADGLRVFTGEEPQETVSEKLDEVDLEIAATWFCPSCSQSNFAELVVADLSREEREDAYRKDNDMEAWQELPDDWDDGTYAMFPKIVSCNGCGNRFQTVSPEAVPEGDEDDWHGDGSWLDPEDDGFYVDEDDD